MHVIVVDVMVGRCQLIFQAIASHQIDSVKLVQHIILHPFKMAVLIFTSAMHKIYKSMFVVSYTKRTMRIRLAIIPLSRV